MYITLKKTPLDNILPKLQRLGMKRPIIIVSTLLSSSDNQCLEMENCANYLQELPLLLVQGMDTVSSLLATNGKTIIVITFIAVYKILATVEEFTGQIHREQHESHVKSYL